MDSGGSHQSTGVPVGDVLVADDSPFAALTAAVDGVLDSGLSPATGDDAAGVIKALERESRRLHAAKVEVMNQIDQRGLHRTDGHSTAQVQVRHVAKLSNGEAAARSKTMRMLRASRRSGMRRGPVRSGSNKSNSWPACSRNGAPLCGKHNRWKQKGYTVQRHPDGTWTTIRPNGTTIDN